MDSAGVVWLIILAITAYVSYRGLSDQKYLDQYSFHVDSILIRKDYKRLLTSGFVHASWMHLIFNLIAFHSFSTSIEIVLGTTKYLVIYFGSLIGGNLFALFIHRNHGDYSAVGASGAVSGLVFAAIGLFPGMEIGLLFLPYRIPSWLYGLLYVLYSLYGIKSQRDNIGHEAHLGGGLVGLLITCMFTPGIVFDNFFPIAMILIPSSIFLYFIITRPGFLLIDNPFSKPRGSYTFEDKYNTSKRDNEKELNKLLDKISKQGMESLTKAEKETLKRLSEVK